MIELFSDKMQCVFAESREYHGKITHLLTMVSGTAGISSSSPCSLSLCDPGSATRPVLLRLRAKNPGSLRLALGVVGSSIKGGAGIGGAGPSEGSLEVPRRRSEKSAVLERRRPGERPGPMVAYTARRSEIKVNERVVTGG